MNPAEEPGAIDATDVAVLDEIRSVWSRLDPVPAGMAERTKFALTMRALEAEVAELIKPELAVTRLGDEVARAESVTFKSPRSTVMVTVDVLSDTTVRIDGWVTTPGALVQVHGPDNDQSTTADETGRFAFESVRRGSVQFVVWPEGSRDGRPVVTPSMDV